MAYWAGVVAGYGAMWVLTYFIVKWWGERYPK